MRIGLLADAANVSREGKLNILGEFNVIWAQTLPVTWPSMQLVIRFEATAGEGPKHHLGIRVVDEDGRQVAPPIEGDMDFGKPFRPGMPYRGQFVMGIQNAQFTRYGAYAFEILINGNSVGRIALYVLPAAERPTQV